MSLTDKIIILSSSLLLLGGCDYRSENDVFKKYSLESYISCEAVSSANQVIYESSDTYTFVVDDLGEGTLEKSPHLLVTNKSFQIKGVCFLQSEKIDSIVGNRIYAKINKSKSRVKNAYRCNLPSQIEMIYTDDGVSSKRKLANKLLSNIEYLSGDSIDLYFNVAEDRYLGFRPNFSIDQHVASYLEPKKSRVSLFDVLFDVEDNSLISISKENGNYFSDHIYWLSSLNVDSLSILNCSDAIK